MAEKRIAAAYIRVSTEDQTEYSPDAQLVEIRKYADHSGYVIPESLVFIDEGISGKKTTKRDGFNRMIGIAKQKPKPFDAILLWKFSRFARNREDSVVYKSMLRKQLGIEVLSVSEPVGEDKMSILIEALIEAMDEYYSINLAEEVKRGMTEKARRGGLQSVPPFGYGVKDNVLVPIPEEAELVRVIFSRFIAGEGLYPIARWLNELGVKTHRGSRFENRTIEYIIYNPAYIGKLRWNPEGKTRRDYANPNIILSEAQHEHLISQETWDAAQAQMRITKAHWRYKKRPATEHKHWLSGVFRCATCNNTLVFGKPHYWKCNAYSKGSCTTSQHTTEEKLTDMLIASMEHDALARESLSYTVIQKSEHVADEEHILQEQLTTLEKRESRLREAYLAGVESLESYTLLKSEISAQIDALQQRIAAIATPSDDIATEKTLKSNILESLKTIANPEATQQEKHTEINSIIDSCVFSKEENSMEITYRVYV